MISCGLCGVCAPAIDNGPSEIVKVESENGGIMPLEREAVVRVALALLDDVGLDGLTARRLAERLGVQNPAL